MQPGTRLGPYEILSPLGAGGMGEVYRAKDTRLGRDVAVKVLPEIVSNDPRALARFESEARAVAALSHPNILALFDVGKEGTVSFVVMELLEGETLREVLAKGPLLLRKALDVALQMAEGLAAAHGKGIVHRDLKPENVFLTKDGHTKLLDFGLARSGPVPASRDETQSPTVEKLTSEGVVLGTVAYMSPEQARGEAVDFRSDQFSLGVVLYEMLTGKRPFGGASAVETLAAIVRDEPEPVTKADPKLPTPVAWVVQRSLSKDPDERYASTKDLARDLQNLRTHLSEAVSASDVARGGTSRLRRRVPFWALVAAVVLTVALGLGFGGRYLRTGAPPASPVVVSLTFPLDASLIMFNTSPLALTPDGKTLVFVGATPKKLLVRQLDREEIKPIPGTEGADQPFISPDGLEVGFFAGGKLKKVALAVGSPMTLCDAPNARGGSWGSDGTIVFVPSPLSGLRRIPASGKEPRVVTTPDAAKGERHFSPQILSDGEHILFDVLDQTEKSNVAVVSLRTGEQRILVEDAAFPRYLPTGHLLFTRPGTLYAVPFSLKRLEISGSPVPVLDDLMTNFGGRRQAEYTFSQEGTLAYVSSLESPRTLVWVDRKGAAEQIPFPPRSYLQVELSPDGRRIAAIVAERGERSALLVGDLARGTLSGSAAEGVFNFPVWTPDGKRVAFGFAPATRGKWRPHTYWQSADGSTPPELLTGEGNLQQDEPTSCSPDGRFLLMTRYDYSDPTPANTGWDIFVLPLSGERKERPFLRTKFAEQDAHFSPDGKWVAYSSNESGDWQVFVRPFSGAGDKMQISTEHGTIPRWSRSGRELFYRNREKMMAVDVETKPVFRAGRPRLLFEWQFPSYDVARDGRFLMIKVDPADLGPDQVKVVLNWFEEVKRRVPGAK